MSALAVTGWSSTARADQVEGTRSERLVEHEHGILLHMDYDHARLVVRRTVHNGGERHDQAVFWIDVPEGSVAVGLRTLGMLDGRPKWFDGQLLEAETAAARYRELTGIGGYYPKDPALLSWRSQRELALQVFPVDPGRPKTVEYTLHLPTSYAEGRHRVELPAMGTARVPAEIVLRPTHPLDQLFVDGEPVGTGTRVVLDHDIEVALARRDAPLLDARLASLAFADDRVLVRYEMRAAARLSEIPRDAKVVVLLDTSRSMSEDDLAGSVIAARAYLDHFSAPRLRASAEVVTFDRTPTRRHGTLTAVDRVLADLETFDPPRRNGSNVDAALEHAIEALDETSKRAPRRIVLFTDALTRSSLTPARLQAIAARSQAIVHVVEPLGGVSDAELTRDDEHAWARVTRATGGVTWRAFVPASIDDEVRDRIEELARPLRVDHVHVRAPGLPAAMQGFPETLDEGDGFGDLLIAATRVRHLQLEGELWSRPIREVVTPSAEHAKLWAGLVFGSDQLAELTEPEMMTLAMHGRAVSPVTSYLAIEPGVRPSTEGLEWDGAEGFGRLGLVGRGAGGGSGTLGSRIHFDPLDWLKARLREALVRCGAPSANADARLETTRDEVVEVGPVVITPSDAVTGDCVTEELWALELPSGFRQAFATWTVRT